MSDAIDFQDSFAPGGKVSPDDAVSDTGIPEFPRKRAEPRSQPLELDARSRLLFWIFRAIIHALSLIPDFILYPLGVLFGNLAYRLDRRHVRIGLKNLEIAFPEKSEHERRRILRESYLNLGRSGAEYVRLAGFFYRRLKRRVAYQGLAHFARALRSTPGTGALVLTAHFGNFELLLAAHALHGYQISLVHHTQRFLAGDALMTFVRERAGVDIIRKHSAARAVLRSLKDGDLVGIPYDQNAKRSEAVFVPFFGEPAATAGAVTRLAMISGASVVPVFLVRQPDRRHHRIVISEAISVQRTGDTEADVLENSRRFVKAVEAAVRAHPEQFLWTHRRYRTRPRDLPPIYDWEVRKRYSGGAFAARAGQRAQHEQHG
ncbi:MAG TPA: lysophospholipid acyltransferase family protein [Candidatus Binataceae bacterium]|nr:lysophospholipid acyltransferase family protein [Candidatus Binataceae bacterium]